MLRAGGGGLGSGHLAFQYGIDNRQCRSTVETTSDGGLVNIVRKTRAYYITECCLIFLQGHDTMGENVWRRSDV